MSYSKYDDDDWSRDRSRPRSISPPSRHRHSNNFFPGNNHVKRGNLGYQRTWHNNYQKRPYYFKPNYRRPYYNHFRGNYHHFDHSNQEQSGDVDRHHQDTGSSYVNEAVQTYDTDKTTVMEVTQLLINEDKDLESRLLSAMERVLREMKRKHEAHLDLVRKVGKSQAT